MPPAFNTFSRLVVAASVIAAFTACAPTSYDAPNTLGVMPLRPPTPIWLGSIAGSGSQAAGATPVDGAAAVTPSQVPGWAHVMISLDNRSAGQVYKWSLRSGSCGSQGRIVGPVDRYGEFGIHADGTGAAETLIPTTLSQSASYAVVATPISPAGADVCADLTHATM